MSLFQMITKEKNFTLETDIEHAVIAYIALLDGLFVEMLFSGLKRARVRLNAS